VPGEGEAYIKDFHRTSKSFNVSRQCGEELAPFGGGRDWKKSALVTQVGSRGGTGCGRVGAHLGRVTNVGGGRKVSIAEGGTGR